MGRREGRRSLLLHRETSFGWSGGHRNWRLRGRRRLSDGVVSRKGEDLEGPDLRGSGDRRRGDGFLYELESVGFLL